MGGLSHIDLIKRVGAYKRERPLDYHTAGYFIWADLLEALSQITDDGVIELPYGVTLGSYGGIVRRATDGVADLEYVS